MEYRVKTTDHYFALSKRCRVIIETLREQSERKWDKLSRIEVMLYVQRLLECLGKLKMEFEAVRE
ncbi:hypothetical protein PENSUB_9367 [Penicillium subrubescens]|uniref:Uncharacterized protein n=1 Tax=Penicillium subrubescens TaxID=1316194 RepID=A0A1Q5TDI0_9EURO|nr:hypothetical protein PENSUB_9367 [Penicillium subrubescens]